MLKVKVISIGRCKEKWLLDALSEYQKRLKGRIEIEWVLVENNEELLSKTVKEPRLIALDLKGELLSSEVLSRKIFLEWGSRIAFVIGGAEGLPKDLKPHFRWSLSPLTFTHQMARLLLVEQLYRAVEIEKGSSYHK